MEDQLLPISTDTYASYYCVDGTIIVKVEDMYLSLEGMQNINDKIIKLSKLHNSHKLLADLRGVKFYPENQRLLIKESSEVMTTFDRAVLLTDNIFLQVLGGIVSSMGKAGFYITSKLASACKILSTELDISRSILH